MNRLARVAGLALRVGLLILVVGRDSNFGLDVGSRVRRFVRGEEFDFITWTLNAIEVKISQISLGEQAYLTDEQQRDVVLRFFDLQEEIERVEGQIADLYINSPQAVADSEVLPLRSELHGLRGRQAVEQPLAEAILQDQFALVLDDLGLAFAGAPIPPVSFHFTPLPLALIVSPREVIRQDANLDLRPGFSVDEREALEALIDRELGVSTFVTPIGGMGTYPTMLAETSALGWAAEVGAHEWIHNVLTLRPLGLSYGSEPEMRTVNETVASLAGREIGQALIARFYPELLPPTVEAKAGSGSALPAPPAFDFNAEMHETRVRADALLAEGKVEDAEAYMEARRRLFVEQGYPIRKLNQAYYAFYGAYADQPGATGSDPVGPLVVRLRQHSACLADFLARVSWMTSFEQVKKAAGG